MEDFDYKILVYSSDSNRSTFWQAQLMKVGVLETNMEAQNINIVPKLQDKTYNACILIPSREREIKLESIMAAIRSNPLASLVPIFVIDQDADESSKLSYYENGANYVLTTKDHAKGAVELCFIIENFLGLVSKYIIGQDRRFLR